MHNTGIATKGGLFVHEIKSIREQGWSHFRLGFKNLGKVDSRVLEVKRGRRCLVIRGTTIGDCITALVPYEQAFEGCVQQIQTKRLKYWLEKLFTE